MAGQGLARRGAAGRGTARRGRAGIRFFFFTGRGMAWRGVAWQGMAWQGMARFLFSISHMEYFYETHRS